MPEHDVDHALNGNIFPRKSSMPLSPGRTDVDAGDEPGIDELPVNEGTTPADQSEAPDVGSLPDTDVDNAEMDDQPNPR